MESLEPHIRLGCGMGIRYALLAGDPGRIDRIGERLEDVEELAYNREYRSLRGRYRGVDILALSTGIGGASMGIAVEELSRIGIKAAIRVGSAGSYQRGIDIGELIVASGAVRDDGASAAYVPAQFPAVADPGLLGRCLLAARALPTPCHVGFVRSHDSFYTDREDAICGYWSGLGVLGADMETAALYTIGALRGVKTLAILNNVVRYQADAGEGIGRYADGESKAARGEGREILLALETVAGMEEADEQSTAAAAD